VHRRHGCVASLALVSIRHREIGDGSEFREPMNVAARRRAANCERGAV